MASSQMLLSLKCSHAIKKIIITKKVLEGIEDKILVKLILLKSNKMNNIYQIKAWTIIAMIMNVRNICIKMA